MNATNQLEEKMNISVHRISCLVLALAAMLLFCSCNSDRSDTIIVKGGQIDLEFDMLLNSRVVSKLDGNKVALGVFNPSESIRIDGETYQDFKFDKKSVSLLKDDIGKGKIYQLSGQSEALKKELTISSYRDFPSMLFLEVTYTNIGEKELMVDGWTNNCYSIKSAGGSGAQPAFWSFQPGSYGWDNDWIQPLAKGFERENYLGMNHIDYGGGTPVVDIWRQDVGLAVGHVEMVPKLVSLPVTMETESAVELAVDYQNPQVLKPGKSLATFKTFVSVHKGDHFRTLSEYRKFMERQGIEFREAPEGAYETIWCGWGFEKNFTMEEFYGAIPMVRQLGIDWVVLDYGWDTGVGDYYLPEDKFPNGEDDMRKVVNDIHEAGAKAKLWWMPLSVLPQTDLYRDHPEYLLLNESLEPIVIEFWKSYFLCPSSEEVRKLTVDFVKKAIGEWGWDGLKIDGNNLNTVPRCYNPAHNHAVPEESVESLPSLFKDIYETALRINPDAVIEICPCGTNQSFFILPYMNQTVASDPHSSWHIRIKGKTLKALTGTKSVFYGDHVELSDERCDFASTVGIGGVPGTKFTWPVGAHDNKETGDIALTPEKEKVWAKWINIYKDKMLSKGLYRGDLYDIGYDRPEAHAVQKDGTMYYAFYAPSYDGDVELRGLEKGIYSVMDYENDRDLGTVSGPTGKLKVSFTTHLLVEVKSLDKSE